ncbi:hypothetical protein B0H15DRAFT_842284 [Mycena belliarum]|uniref:Uncharacterized protein n=1 Tax=Mycena belliarum TaxID=1033014 RepID=A0AAD6XRU0_9AGAR|nr:hypothetical protein B0H15DRAFT_842284 [Mycena belliae]
MAHSIGTAVHILCMEPLRRWSTPQSTHSWWSDANPPGATVSLHTLAKPLLKEMYHRQAMGVIAARGASPFSREWVEMLIPYLTFKDIFAGTRVVVLDCLSSGASMDKEAARTIVDANILPCTPALLQSSDPEVLRLVCNLLENIAAHASLKEEVDNPDTRHRLVSLFSHKSIHVQTAAVEALDRIISDADVIVVRPTVKWWMPYRNRLDGRWPYGIRVTTVQVEDSSG